MAERAIFVAKLDGCIANRYLILLEIHWLDDSRDYKLEDDSRSDIYLPLPRLNLTTQGRPLRGSCKYRYNYF